MNVQIHLVEMRQNDKHLIEICVKYWHLGEIYRLVIEKAIFIAEINLVISDSS